MPNIKISALTDNPTPAASANTVVQEGVANAKVTLTNLVKAAVNGGTAASVGLASVAKSGAYSDLSGTPSLGTISTQASSNVTITGGSITGITDLAIADGGTGASTVGGAVTALGLDYASKNTVGTIVQRDGSGNFLAGTITASLTGNATTATTATTATNLAAGVAGAISYQSGAGTTAFTAAGVSQQVLISNGTSSPTWTDQSNLTVSASGLSGNQTASFIYAGPTTAPAAVASFRAMVSTDVPTLNQNTTGTAAGLSTTLVATSGGTGQSSYAVGDLLYASTTTALSRLAGAAVNNVLRSGGPSVAPAYGKVALATDVSGALPLVNGGTGTAAGTAAAALNALLPSQTSNSAKALITDGTNASWSALGAGTITNVTCTNALSGLTLTPTSPGTSSGAVTIALSGTLGTGNGGTGAVNPATALTNLGAQPVKANLTSFGNVTGANDTMPYFNGTTTMTVAPLLKVGRDFLALTTKVDQANYINSTVSPVTSVALDPCGRLTSDPNIPVNTTDNASLTTLYYAPYKGNIVQLYDTATASWVSRTLPTSTITISLSGLLAATGYDVFINWNGSSVVASTAAWSTGTAVQNNSDVGFTTSLSNPIRFAVTRTALFSKDARLVQTADNTKLYIGSFHTTNTAGQTADTPTQRLIANQYNRVQKKLLGAQSFGNAVIPNASGAFVTPGTEGTSPPNSNPGYVNYQSKYCCTMAPLNGSVWIMGAKDTEYAVQTSCFVQYQAQQPALTNLSLFTATHLSAGYFLRGASLPQVIDFENSAWGAGASGAYQIQTNCNLQTNLHVNMIPAGLVGFQPSIMAYGNTTQYMWHGPVVSGYVYC